MTSDQLNAIIQEMNDFVNSYPGKNIDKENSRRIIPKFDEKHDEWYSVTENARGCEFYMRALQIYSKAVSVSDSPTAELSERLNNYISESLRKSKPYLVIIGNLYRFLGVSYHNLSKANGSTDKKDFYDNRAVEAMKRYVFYRLALQKDALSSPVGYLFRKCSTYLYQALIKEQITVSSPDTFNDPFDSPIIEYYNKKGETGRLISKACLSCVKIACFVYSDENGNPGSTAGTQSSAVEPGYKNILMWSHYADNHKGICIKYKFSDKLTKKYANENEPVRYFKRVSYKDSLVFLNSSKSLSVDDAFFAKSQLWKDENELRLLQCDLNEKEKEHDVIDAKDCIESIYFGVKCPQSDKDTIMRIMGGKARFYQMQYDPTKFGILKAVRI